VFVLTSTVRIVNKPYGSYNKLTAGAKKMLGNSSSNLTAIII